MRRLVHHVVGMRADAAENAEHRLHEQRRLHEPAIEEMREIVKVPGVVALELETRAVVRTGFEDEFNVLEGVAEDAVPAAFEVRLLPVVLEVLEPVEHRIKTEVHRAHVEAGDFRLEYARRPTRSLDGHCRPRRRW